MNNSSIVQPFFALLRSGLWGEPVSDAGFPLSAEAWEELFNLCRRQTVTGIVYRGLEQLPQEWLPAQGLLMRWTVAVDRIETTHLRMNAVVKELFTAWQAEGLHPVLLKGQGVAAWYDEPTLRECGDVDVYFAPEEWERALEVVRRDGAKPEQMPDGSASYVWKGIEVEHHKRMLDVHRSLEVGCEQQCIGGEDGLEVCVPEVTANLLLLNAHILKHVLGLGIGLRQLCDMARAYYTYANREEKSEAVYRLYEKAGVLRWSRLLHAFLVEYVGLPEECLPYKEKKPWPDGKKLLEIVLRGGNFGQHAEGRAEAVQRGGWYRKWHTLGSFVKNVGFAWKYAPQETLRTVAELLHGQGRR